jgi:hypothetical protein
MRLTRYGKLSLTGHPQRPTVKPGHARLGALTERTELATPRVSSPRGVSAPTRPRPAFGHAIAAEDTNLRLLPPRPTPGRRSVSVTALTRHMLSTTSPTSMVVCHYSVRPAENGKTMLAIQPGRYGCYLPSPLATISKGSQGNNVVPVFVHRKTSSKPCELVQRGSLVTAKQFAWVEIEGEKSKTYSLEMGPGDYLSTSLRVSERATKDARKSGFELKRESTITTDPPTVLALTKDRRMHARVAVLLRNGCHEAVMESPFHVCTKLNGIFSISMQC